MNSGINMDIITDVAQSFYFTTFCDFTTFINPLQEIWVPPVGNQGLVGKTAAAVRLVLTGYNVFQCFHNAIMMCGKVSTHFSKAAEESPALQLFFRCFLHFAVTHFLCDADCCHQ